jgi:hypothetical protein
MTTGTAQRSVLLIGASQRILDDSVAGLRDLGYTAQATSDFFSDITGRFDVADIDRVALGGAAGLHHPAGPQERLARPPRRPARQRRPHDSRARPHSAPAVTPSEPRPAAWLDRASRRGDLQPQHRRRAIAAAPDTR